MEVPMKDTTLMNPERAEMLRSIAASGADLSLTPASVYGVTLEPRAGSGANIVGLLHASQKPKTSLKRCHGEFASEGEDAGITHGDRFDKRMRRKMQRPPAFGPPPDQNHDTAYLAGLLRHRPLRLILEPEATRSSAPSAKMYATQITDAGLVLNELVRRASNLPILRLPLLADLGCQPVFADGGINRVAHGSLLEDVWPGLKPAEKYELARQLRKLVLGMRKTRRRAGRQQVGSVVSGKHSLLIDKHPSTTYWAVQTDPTQSQFVAFLVSTFHRSVPNAVAARIASRFGQSGPLALSHGELCPRNIVVSRNKIVAIIGWDCAGWYPEWWEYVKFFETRTTTQNQDWYEYASEIFDKEYAAKLVAYQGVARCQAS